MELKNYDDLVDGLRHMFFGGRYQVKRLGFCWHLTDPDSMQVRCDQCTPGAYQFMEIVPYGLEDSGYVEIVSGAVNPQNETPSERYSIAGRFYYSDDKQDFLELPEEIQCEYMFEERKCDISSTTVSYAEAYRLFIDALEIQDLI